MSAYNINGNIVAGESDYYVMTGKSYYALGDSIVMNSGTKEHPLTVNDELIYGYTQVIEDRYGFICTNRGLSGHTIVDDYNSLMNIDYTNVYLVTIGYGVNDGRLNVPIGVRDGSDTTTFAGCMGNLIKKIYGDNKDCRILILTPIQREYVNLWGNYTQNSNGDTLEDFAEMCKSVANYYATPCVDLFHNSGLNPTTLPALTTDGVVHPNNKGFNRMANCIVEYTDTFFTISRNLL